LIQDEITHPSRSPDRPDAGLFHGWANARMTGRFSCGESNDLRPCPRDGEMAAMMPARAVAFQGLTSRRQTPCAPSSWQRTSEWKGIPTAR
jgi:hypothetical protein